jgi:hippurate hydrolase
VRLQRWLPALAAALVTCAPARSPGSGPGAANVDPLYPEVDALFRDLHQHPELSHHETETSKKLAARFKALGFDVTTGLGKTGFAALLTNGSGPTVMLRAELDALPFEEKTGLAYASHVTGTDESGARVGVMHACGHDAHMSVAYGAAAWLARARDRWRGTLMVVGQPAEEALDGARAMLDDGLFSRVKKPDFALAFHVDADETMPPGTVSVVYGAAPVAGRASVDLTLFGKAGHAASPQRAVDAVVLAAKTVLALQTIVARELDPREPTVVSATQIHGGVDSWTLPEEVKVELLLRSASDHALDQALAAIPRIAKGEAAAAGAPKEPLVQVKSHLPAATNDPVVTRRVANAIARVLGPEHVVAGQPTLVSSDDFSEFGHAGVPSVLLRYGAVSPKEFAAAQAAKGAPPHLHSDGFALDREATLKTGMIATIAAVLELTGGR